MADTPDCTDRVTDAGSCSPPVPMSAGSMSVLLVHLTEGVASLSAQLHGLSQMAGSVSHALRTPMMAIALHADILDEELSQLEGSDHAQLHRSLAVIRENMTRSHDLMQQYLLVACVPDAPRETVELGTYVETLCTEMRAHLAARGLTLQWEGKQALGRVALHQPSFRQAILHVLYHAEDVMPEAGTVTIRGQRFAAHVCLEVHETNRGIPRNELASVFDPLSDTRPRTRGLGLALTREVVRAHQGDITVTSEGGAGTTFTIRLPLLDAAQRPIDTMKET